MSPNKLIRYAMLGLVALVALAAEPTPRGAVEPAPEKGAPEEVKVCIIAVLATCHNDTIDDRVACIAREVNKTYPKLTGFQVHKMMCRTVTVGSRVSFDVIDDQTVGVTVERGVDPDHPMLMKIEAPSLGPITYETCCGKFLPVVTRYRTSDNQLLIIAARVQPCKCPK